MRQMLQRKTDLTGFLQQDQFITAVLMHRLLFSPDFLQITITSLMPAFPFA